MSSKPSPSNKPAPCGLFASRETLNEALDYSSRLIQARIPQEHQAEAFTALWVTLNTALAEIEKLEPLAKPELLPRLTHDEIFATFPRLKDLTPMLTLQFLRAELPRLVLLGKAMEGERHPGASSVAHLVVALAQLFSLSNASIAEEAAKELELIIHRHYRPARPSTH